MIDSAQALHSKLQDPRFTYQSIKICDTCYDTIKDTLKLINTVSHNDSSQQEPLEERDSEDEQEPTESPEQEKPKMSFTRVLAGEEIKEAKDHKEHASIQS